MSEPLVPERTGDLAELGLSEHPTAPLDEIAAGLEEEAQAATAAEPTPEPEVQEAPAQETEPVEEPQESILQSLLQKEQPSEESEVTKLRQQVSRMEGLLEGKRLAEEEAIRQVAPVEEPQKDVRESLLESAPVRQVLAHLKEEDPEQYESALVKIAKEEAVREMQARYESLEGRIVQKEQQEKQEVMASNYQQGIQRVLSDIEGKGGLEAELVQQLRNTPQQSYLGQKFQANPAILMSEEGIRGAAMSVAAELKAQYETQQSTAATVSPSVEGGAGGGSPSMRGVSLGDKPEVKSEDDQIIEDMMNVGNRTRALDFF